MYAVIFIVNVLGFTTEEQVIPYYDMIEGHMEVLIVILDTDATLTPQHIIPINALRDMG